LWHNPIPLARIRESRYYKAPGLSGRGRRTMFLPVIVRPPIAR
jgi:hypothetical protein